MSSSSQAYEALRRGIVHGSYPPGSWLRETHLVDALGVSRTPIREALRRLHAEGLVAFQPNRGAQVAVWSEQDLLDVFDIRLIIESFATRLAAERITPSELESLSAIIEKMAKALDDGSDDPRLQMAELNNEFHRIIVGAAHSPTVATIMSTAVTVPTDRSFTAQTEMPLVARALQAYSRAQLERSLWHHREILDALRAKNPDWAEAITRTHILASRAVFASSTAPQP